MRTWGIVASKNGQFKILLSIEKLYFHLPHCPHCEGGGAGYCGAEDIETLKTTGKFVKISAASLKESHPHDIHITKEAPNYSVDE